MVESHYFYISLIKKIKIMKKICECKYKELNVGDYFRIKREKEREHIVRKSFRSMM